MIIGILRRPGSWTAVTAVSCLSPWIALCVFNTASPALASQQAVLESPANQEASTEGSTVVAESGMWGWNTGPRAVVVHGTTYVGFVDGSGTLTVTALHEDGRHESLVLESAYDPSRTASPVFAPLPDGRLLVFYVHADSTAIIVREITPDETGVRVSPARSIQIAPPWEWDDDAWRRPAPTFTYADPNVAFLEDGGRAVIVSRRGPWGDQLISFSDDLGRSWSVGRPLFGRAGAVKLFSDGKKRVHFLMTGYPANSVYHFYYEGEAFYRASGERIGGLEDLPLQYDDLDVVYDGVAEGAGGGLLDIAVTPQGAPVVAYVRFNGESGAEYRYAVWNGRRWRDRPMAMACPIAADSGEEGRRDAPRGAAGVALDYTNPAIAYVSTGSGDRCVLERWITSDHGDTWSSLVVGGGSQGAWRPVTARGVPAEWSALLWLTPRSEREEDFSVRAARLDNVRDSAALTPTEILKVMREVADWQLRVPIIGSPTGFSRGALGSGLLALARLPGGGSYKAHVLSMAAEADWRLGGDGDPRRRFNPLSHTMGQVYLELYEEFRDPAMLADVKALGDELLVRRFNEPLSADDDVDDPDWAFADALFMTPTLLARLGAVTGDSRYLDLLDEMWWRTTDYLLDPAEHLFYRDSRYFRAPPIERFWSRGNGWVLAGLARSFPYLPDHFSTRERYENLFRLMAARIATLQQEDGFWRSSLHVPSAYPMPETSGTGFFVFALAWGINEGLLDRDEYLPIVRAGWAALVSAVDVNGKLGWSQAPSLEPGRSLTSRSNPYAVGAFLLAGAEIYRLVIEKSTG